MGFVNGAFHIADFYTIHHDQDNLMYFTPKSQGVIKIFISQPEEEELMMNDEVFDIEIGLYDVSKERFVATSMNQHLPLEIGGVSGKLEYASLTYNIPYDSVNKPFILMFRALNFTNVNEGAACEAVYIELEYAEKNRECKYDKAPPKGYDVVKVSENQPYKSIDY